MRERVARFIQFRYHATEQETVFVFFHLKQTQAYLSWNNFVIK